MARHVRATSGRTVGLRPEALGAEVLGRAWLAQDDGEILGILMWELGEPKFGIACTRFSFVIEV